MIRLIAFPGSPDDAMAAVREATRGLGLRLVEVDLRGKEDLMAYINVSGGGSIPDRSKSLTCDGTPEGHTQLFKELREFVDEWESATVAQDATTSEPAATDAPTSDAASTPATPNEASPPE